MLLIFCSTAFPFTFYVSLRQLRPINIKLTLAQQYHTFWTKSFRNVSLTGLRPMLLLATRPLIKMYSQTSLAFTIRPSFLLSASVNTFSLTIPLCRLFYPNETPSCGMFVYSIIFPKKILFYFFRHSFFKKK